MGRGGASALDRREHLLGGDTRVLVLPDPQDRPSRLGEQLVGLLVAGTVPRDLRPPLRPQAPATRVLLSHFPYAGDSRDEDCYSQFRLRDASIPLLHGHAHEAFLERRTKKGTWGINVGGDWWDYAPVAAETLAHHLEDLHRDRVAAVDGTR